MPSPLLRALFILGKLLENCSSGHLSNSLLCSVLDSCIPRQLCVGLPGHLSSHWTPEGTRRRNQRSGPDSVFPSLASPSPAQMQTPASSASRLRMKRQSLQEQAGSPGCIPEKCSLLAYGEGLGQDFGSLPFPLWNSSWERSQTATCTVQDSSPDLAGLQTHC